MTIQIIARVPDDLARAVDDLVAQGAFASRSDAVRLGLDALVDARRRAALGEQIVEGYRRHPPTDDEGGWSDAASVAMIAEEPW